MLLSISLWWWLDTFSLDFVDGINFRTDFSFIWRFKHEQFHNFMSLERFGEWLYVSTNFKKLVWLADSILRIIFNPLYRVAKFQFKNNIFVGVHWIIFHPHKFGFQISIVYSGKYLPHLPYLLLPFFRTFNSI